MGRVRYAKSLRDLERTRAARGDSLDSRIRQIRCIYETDAEVAQAVVPRPFEATTDPEVHVSFSTAAIPLSPDVTLEFGTMSFGVAVHYDGRDAIYPLTMVWTDESLVIEGRERFGQPNKWGRVDFDAGRERVRAGVERRGIRFLAIDAEYAEELGPTTEDVEAYCFKAFPGCQPSKGFDQDPQLVRLEVSIGFDRVVRLEGDLDLVESAFDPVADLPVRRMASLEYREGHCRSSGRVLRPVPGEWLLPFLHQRSDDPEVDGVDV
jgi:Acetoacetate decarboxylase (ADC)